MQRMRILIPRGVIRKLSAFKNKVMGEDIWTEGRGSNSRLGEASQDSDDVYHYSGWLGSSRQGA